MSTNYHDAIPFTSPGNSSVINIPLGQLDATIGDILAGVYQFSNLLFTNAQTVQLDSSGVLPVPTQLAYIVESFSGNRDELDNIPSNNNSYLLLKAASGHEIVINSNVVGANNLEVILTENDIVALYCQNSQWYILNQATSKRFSNRLFCSGYSYEAFASTNTISIAAGSCSSDNGRAIIEDLNSGSVDLDTTGSGGLDTGTVAANTTYYLWKLRGESGVTQIASTNLSAPILPSGYEDYKRRIGSVITDGSAVVMSGYIAGDEGLTRRFHFTQVTKAAPYQLLNEANIGQTGSRTSVDFTDVVPSDTSRSAICLIEIVTPGGTADVFWSATGSRDTFVLSCAGTGQISSTVYDLEISPLSRTAQIYSSAAVDEDLSLYCLGWIDYGLGVLGYTP